QMSRSARRAAPWAPPQSCRGLLAHGINVGVIIVVAFVVVRAAHLAIEHLQYKVGHRHARADLEWQRRAATLSGILARVVSAVVAFLAFLMLLSELSLVFVFIISCVCLY